jgi:Right handed beta helix region
MNRLAAIFTVTVLALVASAPAYAQATRTWVSGVGDDANPCSRTAPCKTYAGAISKTAAGGEISALDPGGFGAVTVTKAMTINGDGDLASTTSPGTSGVTVAAGATDVVVLRSLSINGVGSGTDGVRMISGAMLVVENCAISGFTQNGIEIAVSGTTALSVRKTSLIGGAAGVRITSGTVNASLRDVSIVGATNGVYASSGTTSVSHSVIAQNTGVGALADGGAVVSLESNMLTGNGTAAQALTGSIVRLSNNDLFDNIAGFGCGGGILATAANNRKAGNTGGGTVCAPTASINVQ